MRIFLIVAAALVVATPAVAQTSGLFGERRGPGIYDYSTASANSERAPNYQSRRAGRLQTGDGQESGGYARERIPASTGSITRRRSRSSKMMRGSSGGVNRSAMMGRKRTMR